MTLTTPAHPTPDPDARPFREARACPSRGSLTWLRIRRATHTPSAARFPGSQADANQSQASTKSRRGRVLALLCLIYFLVILDAAIVRLALPSIHLALGLSPASQTWVANSYMLSFGTLLLLGGRLADLLGRKRMLLIGVGVFTLASLACGLAPSGAMLIAARAVQGLGAAAMTPAALSILMRTFPEGAERNRAIGAWGATGGIAATAAWIVGGPLIDGPGWQWVFWINVPAGSRSPPWPPACCPRVATRARRATSMSLGSCR